jgi:hypothetical protein
MNFQDEIEEQTKRMAYCFLHGMYQEHDSVKLYINYIKDERDGKHENKHGKDIEL